MTASYDLPIEWSRVHQAYEVSDGHGGEVIASFDALHLAEAWVLSELDRREAAAS